MIIENKKTASIIRLLYLFIPVLITILIAISVYFKSFPNYTFYTILFSLTIIIFFLAMKLKLYYVFLSDEKGKISVKYLSLSPLGGTKSAFEIKQQDFIRYNIKTSFRGYKKTIIMFIRTSQGIAKYPPVSISALSKEQIKKLHFMLQRYVKK